MRQGTNARMTRLVSRSQPGHKGIRKFRWLSKPTQAHHPVQSAPALTRPWLYRCWLQTMTKSLYPCERIVTLLASISLHCLDCHPLSQSNPSFLLLTASRASNEESRISSEANSGKVEQHAAPVGSVDVTGFLSEPFCKCLPAHLHCVAKLYLLHHLYQEKFCLKPGRSRVLMVIIIISWCSCLIT